MQGLWFKGLWVLVMGACAFALYQGMDNLSKVKAELKSITETNQRLDRENRALYRRVSRLRGDREAMSRAVRHEQGLIRPDEVVYELDTPQGESAGRARGK